MKTYISKIVLACITVMLLSINNSWAGPSPNGCGPSGWVPRKCQIIQKTPEIDAVSGVSAIVLLTGVLLLVAEKARSRRT
jgi:hypothetical protein